MEKSSTLTEMVRLEEFHLEGKLLKKIKFWADFWSAHFFFVTLQQNNNIMSNKITFNKPINVVHNGKAIKVFEIRVLKNGNPSKVYGKDANKAISYDYEHLDAESKEKIDKVVERNMRYL